MNPQEKKSYRDRKKKNSRIRQKELKKKKLLKML